MFKICFMSQELTMLWKSSQFAIHNFLSFLSVSVNFKTGTLCFMKISSLDNRASLINCINKTAPNHIEGEPISGFPKDKNFDDIFLFKNHVVDS